MILQRRDESENTTFDLLIILLTGTTTNFEPTNPEFSRFLKSIRLDVGEINQTRHVKFVKIQIRNIGIGCWIW